jgi:lipid-A-disaccharide synthase
MPDRSHPVVMLVAGEASGDRHAAALFRELKARLPGVRGIGMGGQAMCEAGVEILCDSSGLGVIGVIEVIRRYGEIRRVLTRMQAVACEQTPDLLICVDYKEFNYRLARKAKSCGVKVLFYVGPQIWAWRSGRARTYGAAVSHMAVIFPFEVPYYEAAGVPVTYVGHPLAGQVKPRCTREDAQAGLGLPGQGPVIGLLPGSRANEIKRLLPVMLASAERLLQTFPDAHFLLAQAASIDDELLASHLREASVPVRVIQGMDYDLLQCCDVVITSSGTATLEVALLGLPMIIVYRLAPFSYWLGRLLVSIRHIGLPNILAGETIVREFIQHDANPDNICAEAERILSDPVYALEIRSNLTRLHALLGAGGGSRNLADLAVRMLSE